MPSTPIEALLDVNVVIASSKCRSFQVTLLQRTENEDVESLAVLLNLRNLESFPPASRPARGMLTIYTFGIFPAEELGNVGPTAQVPFGGNPFP